METYTLPQFPPAYRRVSVAYFVDVQNAAEIKAELVRAATMEGEEGEEARRRVDFAFIEGDVVVSRLHLLTAIQTALLTSLPQPSPPASGATTPRQAALTSSNPSPSHPPPSDAPPSSLPSDAASPSLKTKTHNIHSEILLSLNPNNNISDALRAFSVSDKTKHLLVVRISPEDNFDDGGVYAGIKGLVDGRLVSVDEVQGNVDWTRVDKLYKLAELNQVLRGVDGEEAAGKKRAAVVNTVAVKPST